MPNKKDDLTGKELAIGYGLVFSFVFLIIYGISSLGSYGKVEDEQTSYSSHSNTSPNAVDAASAVCAMMENTNLVSECEVQGWGSTVDVTIDTVGPEAIKMCSDTTTLIASQTSLFSGRGWRLRIFSPYSGDRPLASCAFH
jgi:hypothetical protein